MSHDFSHSVDRTGSRAEKWDRGNIAGICGNADALPFWVADMDLPVSDGIRQALEDEARLGVIGYRNNSALRPAFISFMKERHDTVLDEDHVAFAQGMLHAIALAMNVFTKEGDRILLPYPSYHPFIDMIEDNGRIIVPYHLKRTRDGFALDLDEWKAAGEGCQAILFCSPHNPTGIVFTDSELESILTLARDRGQLVLCDEIHSDLALPGFRHIPMVKANEGIGADVITFAAASKSFNIAGEHCAFACFSSKEMKERYEKVEKRLHLTGPGYSVASMAEMAYLHGMEYNRRLCRHLERNQNRLEEFLRTRCPELKLCKGHASFIVFIDCSAIWDKVVQDRQKNPQLYDGDHFVLSHFFGQRGGICMNDGTWFGGDEYKCYVRFNFGCGEDLLEKGLEGLEKAVEFIRKA